MPLRTDVFTDLTTPTSPSCGAGPWSDTMRGLSIPRSSASALAVSLTFTSCLIFAHAESVEGIRCTFLLVDATAATPKRPVQGHGARAPLHDG